MLVLRNVGVPPPSNHQRRIYVKGLMVVGSLLLLPSIKVHWPLWEYCLALLSLLPQRMYSILDSPEHD